MSILAITGLSTSIACSEAEPTKPDAGGGVDAEVVEDATVIVPAGDLTGIDEITWVNETTEVTVPLDHASTAVAAWVESARSYVKLPGSGESSGAIRIPDVPAGPLLVQLGATYVVTSARAIDFGSASLGRADATVIHAPTKVHFSIAGLDPWKAGDGLEVMALNVGELIYDAQKVGMFPPAIGDSSLTGFTVDLLDGETGGYLLDETKGDRIAIAQLSTRSSTGADYRVLTKLFTTDPLTIPEGVDSIVNGTFTDVPQTSMLTLDWRRSEFAALQTELHPYAVPEMQAMFVEVQPGGTTHGNFSGVPDLFLATPSSGDEDVSFGTVSFGNPYPSAWPVIYGALHIYTVPYSLPGARHAVRLRAAVLAQARGSDGGQPVRPLVGPVRDVKIEGQDAWHNVSGVGTTPLIEWTPPAMGTPTEYQIEVVHLYASSTSGDTQADTLASLRTTAPRLRIPPEILQPGEAYVFSVIAWWDESEDLERAPNKVGLAAAGATVLTSIVRP